MNDSTYEEDVELAFEQMRQKILENKSLNNPNKSNKKYKIIDTNQFKLTNCKVCNISIKISCKYDGQYPLCYVHRDPNNR